MRKFIIIYDLKELDFPEKIIVTRRDRGNGNGCLLWDDKPLLELDIDNKQIRVLSRDDKPH